MKRLTHFVFIFFFFWLVACDSSPQAITPPNPPPQTFYVHAQHTLGQVPPTIYGTNYGPWITVPLGVMEPFKESGIELLRFPGGQYGDENTIRQNDLENLKMFADMIESEVHISTNLLNGTPEQAVALLNLSQEVGLDVRYWSIGNEPTLYATMYNAEQWDTAHYNEQWRIFALALKEANPDILLFGPDVHQFRADSEQNPKDVNGVDWMEAFLEANGDLVDVVTIHRYPFPTSMTAPQVTADELYATASEWDETIPMLRSLIQEKTGRDLPIGVMEINSHWSKGTSGEATPDSFANALWWGDVLGRMMKNDVTYVTHFALQSSSGQGGWGLLARYDVRPAYYTYQLYQQFGTELLYSASDQELVSIYAAKRDDGALTLMVVNLTETAVTQPLQIEGFTIEGNAQRWLLDETHMGEQLPDETIDGTLTAPPYSMTLWVLEGE